MLSLENCGYFMTYWSLSLSTVVKGMLLCVSEYVYLSVSPAVPVKPEKLRRNEFDSLPIENVLMKIESESISTISIG